MENKATKIFLNTKVSAGEFKKMLFNHSFWETRTRRFTCSHKVSWEDKNMVRLEIDNIRNYIRDHSIVLDAGCSNGFSTFEIARNKDICVRAFDFSKSAIKIAKRRQRRLDLNRKITFYCGNILNIEEKDNFFDIVYSIRVLINLPSRRRQKQAILEMHRVLKPGGIYLMSEAFLGGLKNLNCLRSVAGMKPLTVHKFNLYLREEVLGRFVKKYFDIVAIKKFASIYYVASRFLRYLTLRKGERDSYDNEINNLFVKYPETENSGDFGIQKLYILRKKKL